MPYLIRYQTTKELSNGDIFRLQSMANITPATFDDPEEIEFFDATYYINGKEVSWNPLPQEIKNAFCKMWDNMTEDSSYHEEDTFDPCDDLPYGDYDEPASTYARE